MLRSRRDHLKEKKGVRGFLSKALHGGKGGKQVLEYETHTLRYLLSAEVGVVIE